MSSNPKSSPLNPQPSTRNPDLDALAEFAAGAGHEINNPLAIIGGHAQMLLSQIEDPEQRRSLAVILAQVNRAYEMMADIRLFARPPQPELQPFDLFAKIDELTQNAQPEIVAPTITLQWKRPKEPLMIESDPTQLSVAMNALLRNASESIAESPGTIAIDVQMDNNKEFVEISITDDGPGIPAEIRPLIFSPYFSGRQAGRGLGFGLPKAWRIVTNNGGSLTVADCDEPKKTQFVIRLPINAIRSL